MAAENDVAEASEEGEIPELNCNKRFKTGWHSVAVSCADVFADLPAGLPSYQGVGHTVLLVMLIRPLS